MHPNLLSGKKAQEVAAYVASVAGIPGKYFNCATGTSPG
jgi:hypothetical protein